MKTKNKRAGKRKEWLAKLCAPIESLLFPCLESSPFLSPCSMPALVPTLVLASVPTFMSDLVPTLMPAPMPVFVLVPLPALVYCPESPAVWSFYHIRVFRYKISVLLFPLPSILGLSLFLRSSPLRIIKRFLSDEPWPHMSTSPEKPLCLFSALGMYNSTDNNKCNRGFNTAFINSHPLTSNHNQKERNLSFTGCRYSDVVKSNLLW